MTMGNFYAILGVAIATIVSGIGSAIGVGRAGQAASALLSKRPEKFGEVMVLQVMPSTQGMYGFVVGLMALINLGALSGNFGGVSVETGLTCLAYCLPVAIVGLVSAIMQGNVAISCINLVGKQDGQQGHAMIMLILVEMFAVFALIVSVLGVMSL